MKTFLSNFSSVFFSALFQFGTYYASEAQNVGIGTSNPRATLHVAGTLRADSAPLAVPPYRIAVLDSIGNLGALHVDTVKSWVGGASQPACLYASHDSIQSMQDQLLQTGLSILLPPGSYQLMVYCEVTNDSYLYAARVAVCDEHGNEVAYMAPFSQPGIFSPCFVMAHVTVSAPTRYYLRWAGSYYTTTRLRHARFSALRL